MSVSGWIRAIAVWLILAALASCDPTVDARGAPLFDTPVDVVLTPYLGRLVTVDAVLRADTIRLIMDTGGGETLISPEVAERLGCDVSGRSVGFRMNGERVEFERCFDVTLEIGGVSIAHDEIGVWDIGAVLPPDVPPVDGVLSLRTFAKQPFTLDLSEARLILESEESLAARTAGGNRLRSRVATGIDGDELTVLVHARAPAPGWLLIDSANLDVVQLAPHMSPPGTGDEPWEAELRLDGLPLARAQARTRDILYDGALSESFLRGWTLTFDLRSGAVWAAPARGAIGAAVPDS